MQGSVFGPIKCVTHFDTLGSECLSPSEEEISGLYKYKNTFDIPPLSMVDDIFEISRCDSEAIEINLIDQCKK